MKSKEPEWLSLVCEEAWKTLVCVIDAGAFHCVDDWDIRAVLGDEYEVSLAEEHLQELVRRSWLELVDLPDGKGGTAFHVNVTPAGNYHAARWLKAYEKAKRKAARAR